MKIVSLFQQNYNLQLSLIVVQIKINTLSSMCIYPLLGIELKNNIKAIWSRQNKQHLLILR